MRNDEKIQSSLRRQEKATRCLVDAYDTAKKANNQAELEQNLTKEQLNLIDTVLLGNHKTYRYILVTAIVSKLADPSVNILSLQASDRNPGAYDARTIAHKVVVPFERKYLNEALGGSNEPYLNKPARFPAISKKNAVRRGKDKEKLDLLVDTLPTFTPNQLKSALDTMMYRLQQVKKDNGKRNRLYVNSSDYSKNKVIRILSEIVENSLEGQTLPLAIAVIFKEIMTYMQRETRVEIHKVNQAGSSSKEVEDIDIYTDEVLCYAVEAKDKIFSVQDVEHSIEKVKNANVPTLFFIYGNKIYPDEETIRSSKELATKEGVYLVIQKFEYILEIFIGLARNCDYDELDEDLYDFARQANMTDSVFDWIQQVLK